MSLGVATEENQLSRSFRPSVCDMRRPEDVRFESEDLAVRNRREPRSCDRSSSSRPMTNFWACTGGARRKSRRSHTLLAPTLIFLIDVLGAGFKVQSPSSPFLPLAVSLSYHTACEKCLETPRSPLSNLRHDTPASIRHPRPFASPPA